LSVFGRLHLPKPGKCVCHLTTMFRVFNFPSVPGGGIKVWPSPRKTPSTKRGACGTPGGGATLGDLRDPGGRQRLSVNGAVYGGKNLPFYSKFRGRGGLFRAFSLGEAGPGLQLGVPRTLQGKKGRGGQTTVFSGGEVFGGNTKTGSDPNGPQRLGGLFRLGAGVGGCAIRNPKPSNTNPFLSFPRASPGLMTHEELRPPGGTGGKVALSARGGLRPVLKRAFGPPKKT